MGKLAARAVSLSFDAVAFSFIQLADYLILGTLHQLMVHSLAGFLDLLNDQLATLVTIQPAISQKEIEAMDEPMYAETEEKVSGGKIAKQGVRAINRLFLSKEGRESKVSVEKQTPPPQQQIADPFVAPMFLSELRLELAQLRFCPSHDDYHKVIGGIVDKMQGTVLSIENLVQDDYFNPFTM